jgi:DNA-binding NtrC family response regulator
MSKTVLMLGRTDAVLDDLKKNLEMQDIQFLSGKFLEDVQKKFDEESIDIVIMGAGLELDARLEIIQHIFTVSKSTTVHMKDWNSGPDGMLPFVKRIVS